MSESLVLNKVSGWLATLSKKKLWHWCFSINFAKFLRTPFHTEHLRLLLLAFPDMVVRNRAKQKLYLTTIKCGLKENSID